MNVNDFRISKLREYLFEIINTLTTNRDYQINANMLSNKVDDYSLNKIPTMTVIEAYVDGTKLYRDVYSFRSRKSYSQDAIVNLKNMGFFEQFEYTIETNNEEGNLPEIDGIENIECLNPFTMISNDDGKSATFDIQIQIEYEAKTGITPVSL